MTRASRANRQTTVMQFPVDSHEENRHRTCGAAGSRSGRRTRVASCCLVVGSGNPSLEPCPCCRYNAVNMAKYHRSTAEEWRIRWIHDGMRWWAPYQNPAGRMGPTGTSCTPSTRTPVTSDAGMAIVSRRLPVRSNNPSYSWAVWRLADGQCSGELLSQATDEAPRRLSRRIKR